jgi:hypothetical protein
MGYLAWANLLFRKNILGLRILRRDSQNEGTWLIREIALRKTAADCYIDTFLSMTALILRELWPDIRNFTS